MGSIRPLLLALLLGACATVPKADAADVDLRDLDGAPAALHTEAHEATVLVFWSTGCPCVARYRERVAALEAAWRERGVQVIAISSNVDDDPATLREFPAPVPLLIDEGGRLAQALGAHSTPTAVLLDREGAIRYRGWIDNERFPGEPGREPWLEEALDDLVAGREVRRAAAPTWGCAITRSLVEGLRCQPLDEPR
ncbi:redoxin domain-containing protein [Vulgatibacter sp.]|uniref:redoxin domain-containing protein n=1 Tax=Vulgatibacter sp. TaxID=1971226 RepID=UPI00356A288E